MSYLIDTGTLLELLRAAPPQALVRRLSQVPASQRFTSAITVSQILLAARHEDDARLMQDVVGLVAAIQVAPYDLSASQAFARFRARMGDAAETDDVMIAAIAASRDFTLVTRRTELFGHFSSLRLEDWTR